MYIDQEMFLNLCKSLVTSGNKVETWKFKATESADRVQMIICWLMAYGSKF